MKEQMKIPGLNPTPNAQRSSLESFLDEYQLVRIAMNGAGLITTIVLLLGGWWNAGPPVVSLLGSLSIGGHAVWCRLRGVRAPKTMLVMDTTIVGLMMLTLPDHQSVTAALFGLVAVLIVLFSQGRWMAGLLAYAAGWFTAASLTASTVDPYGNLQGGLFVVAALAILMVRVRQWLGRLDANRSQMVGTVSHELRNTLTGVLGLTDLVSSMDDLQPAEAKELVEMANHQAMDAIDIVEDLLTASRVERAALTLSSEVVDVNEEVAKTAHRFQGTGTDIGLLLSDSLPPAWADSLRVRQAIRNLLSNAIRYGGPTITIATRHAGDMVELTVRDDGDGVPPEDEKTIFLPYKRSAQGRRDASSIGLGLWICRQIAQGMGGGLEYQRRGDFTEFILNIPVARSHQDSEGEGAVADHEGREAVSVSNDMSRSRFGLVATG